MERSNWEVGAFWLLAISLSFAQVPDESKAVMTPEEMEDLKLEAKDMFYHAYNAYMENAYPADELMPLSCKGRYRDPLNSRGDLDDTLGNFSLTLIDTLDSLVVLGDIDEFDRAVKLIADDVTFDQDVIVSVFETNIRVLGGLLSAHILAEYLQQRDGVLPWYRAELLSLAKDLGYRLLPAFNTTTGIPYSRINLRHGMKPLRLSAHVETCTSCAGTMILELAALSRLTGEPVFEEKAHRAMDELWRLRHRSSDLMGNVLNVHSGDWVRRDSGVGAGIDSYYEYCLKAYILLGDETYLTRFNRHYTAVMKYISQGPMLLDVHMHRPHTNSKNFMDALLAFWPGLQVLMGDIAPAVATHEMLYQVMMRHNLIPEAFTTDFQVHWGQHPLRPEFVESTYFLYKATNDPYYLQVGKAALKSLQKHARVPCGYATIKDVRTGGHDDRMDSFVLAETFKYLYLLFAKPSELLLDLDEFIFTTEAHLLPLTLARGYNYSRVTSSIADEPDSSSDLEAGRTCPNTLNLFPETVRLPLKNMVDGMCPRRSSRRRLYASQFTAGNPEHLQLLKSMGISVLSLSDGRVHLLQSAASARTGADAAEGLLFMQEMVELSQAQKQQPERPPVTVTFRHVGQELSITAGRAQFGRDLVSGMKVRRAELAGAIAVIVVDNTPGSSSVTSSMFAMSGDGTDDVMIPAVFLFYQDASQLLKAIVENPGLEITIADNPQIEQGKLTQELTDSLLGRLRGSFEELLAGKAGGRRDKGPEGPDHRHKLDNDLEEVVRSKTHTPPWLLKLYEKLVLDTQRPLDQLQSDHHPHTIVDYVMKVYLSEVTAAPSDVTSENQDEFSSTQRDIHTRLQSLKLGSGIDVYREAYSDIKSMLAHVEHLVAVMTNDSEFSNSEKGAILLSNKMEFLKVLRVLVGRFESHIAAEGVTTSSNDVLIAPEDLAPITPPNANANVETNDSNLSKDEL